MLLMPFFTFGQEKNSEGLAVANQQKSNVPFEFDCNEMEQRLEVFTMTGYKKQSQRMTAYKKTNDVLYALVDKLEINGYDTKSLAGKVSSFSEKVATFSNVFSEYSKSVSSTEDVVCVSKISFKSALQKMRNNLQSAEKENNEILALFKDIQNEIEIMIAK